MDKVCVVAETPILEVYKGAQSPGPGSVVRPVASVEEINAVNETNGQVCEQCADRLLIPPIGNIGNVERHEISGGRHSQFLKTRNPGESTTIEFTKKAFQFFFDGPKK
jgi:hypothetical protein